ncbi:MAG TPA: Zn-ribbon domain-containing OB-fold protein [Burkholderiaceae bacterium]|nr:Zn-ribbon domain-containing OB-fold protein [Burkholderiaceae bacterium]
MDAIEAAPSRPRPQPIAETRAYWEGARNGRLLIQRCADCGRHQFYPRPFCTTCLAERVNWVEAAGRGHVVTFTICRIAAHPALTPPYAVALVELDEGVRLLANIVDCELDAIRCGARVQVRFERLDDEITLPQFTLV